MVEHLVQHIVQAHSIYKTYGHIHVSTQISVLTCIYTVCEEDLYIQSCKLRGCFHETKDVIFVIQALDA